MCLARQMISLQRKASTLVHGVVAVTNVIASIHFKTLEHPLHYHKVATTLIPRTQDVSGLNSRR